jgi:hypothetical protein
MRKALAVETDQNTAVAVGVEVADAVVEEIIVQEIAIAVDMVLTIPVGINK